MFSSAVLSGPYRFSEEPSYQEPLMVVFYPLEVRLKKKIQDVSRISVLVS